MKPFSDAHQVLELLSEAISEGVVIVDEQQTIITVNAAIEKNFGYTTEELTGQHLNILIPSKYHPSHSRDAETFIKQGEKRRMGYGRNLYGCHKSGVSIPVEAGLNPFLLEGETYVMAIVIDISERLEQENKIRELNSQLEEKIRARTHQLKQTVENLEQEINKRQKAEQKIKSALKRERELNELKTKFLSLVSHEFKTPLSGILTSTILAGKYKLAEQQDKRDKHLRTITDKVHYLNNILNDFLSVERLESGKVTYKPTHFSFGEIVNQVVENARSLLKDGQQIDITSETKDHKLYQDEKIVELCLSNLIHNAIKYSPENTTIFVTAKRQDEVLHVSIRDQGMGIPETAQKNIFSRYYRAENVLNEQGTGIGLNITRVHLKNLGGKISFASKENEGSTFHFSIPMIIPKHIHQS